MAIQIRARVRREASDHISGLPYISTHNKSKKNLAPKGSHVGGELRSSINPHDPDCIAEALEGFKCDANDLKDFQVLEGELMHLMVQTRPTAT